MQRRQSSGFKLKPGFNTNRSCCQTAGSYLDRWKNVQRLNKSKSFTRYSAFNSRSWEDAWLLLNNTQNIDRTESYRQQWPGSVTKSTSVDASSLRLDHNSPHSSSKESKSTTCGQNATEYFEDIFYAKYSRSWIATLASRRFTRQSRPKLSQE